MKISDYTLCMLAGDTYKDMNSSIIIEDKKIKSTWQVDARYTSRVINFACNLYFINHEDVYRTKSAVLVFRGTDGLFDWLIDNRAIATGSMPPQALLAIQMAKLAKSSYTNLTLTGHSLGGALAIIAGAHTSLDTVTFNAPGAKKSCLSSSSLALLSTSPLSNFIKTVENCSTGSNVRNIVNGNDMVSTKLLQQVGTTKVVTDSVCKQYSPLCRHSIQTMADSLQSNNNGASGSW
jgi:Lipase (class 3)